MKVVPEKIHIDQINVFKSIVDIDESIIKDLDSIEGYSFALAQESGFIEEEKAARILLNILLEGKNKAEEELPVKVEFAIETIFVVDNLDEFIVEKSEKQFMDGSIVSWLTAIAYSTARGIVLQETKNTMLNGVIIPVVDPVKLLEEENDLNSDEESIKNDKKA